MEADFVPGEGACKCSEGDCKHTPMERNGWEVQGVGVVRLSILDWKAAAADRGEGLSDPPEGFCHCLISTHCCFVAYTLMTLGVQLYEHKMILFHPKVPMCYLSTN